MISTEDNNPLPDTEPDTLLWVTAFASIALTLGVLASHVIWSVETEPVKSTDCGYRWTADARYVQHINYGQGCAEVRDD